MTDPPTALRRRVIELSKGHKSSTSDYVAGIVELGNILDEALDTIDMAGTLLNLSCCPNRETMPNHDKMVCSYCVNVEAWLAKVRGE